MPFKRKTLGDLELMEFGNSSQLPAVIFLHGGPGMYGYMQTFCQEFSSICNVVYYEQRGSRQGNIKIGISDHIQDLEMIVDHYSLTSKPMVVGHSWGAMLAILFAGSKPSKISKTISIGSGPLNKIQGEEFQKELVSRFGTHREYYDNLWNITVEEQDVNRQQKLASNYVEKMMPIYQMDPSSGMEIQPLLWDFKGGFNTMCESDDFVERGEYEKSLPNISSPLTVIQGSHDIISPESLFNLVKTHVPHVNNFEIRDAGHYPWAGKAKSKFLKILSDEVRDQS